MDEIIRIFSCHSLPAAFTLSIALFYAGMILLFLAGWRRLPSCEEECKDPQEKVAVIVACHNEEKNLPALIDALCRQRYPAALTEIILVDDHSTDRTGKLIRQATEQDRRIKALRSRGRGKKEALLTAAGAATAPLLFTTDADARPAPDWISVMMACRRRTGARLLAGPVTAPPGKGVFSMLRELEMYSLTGAGAGAAGTGHPLYCSGASMAYEKELLTVIPDPLRKEIQSGDDVFLLHAVKQADPGAVTFVKSRRATVTVTDRGGVAAFFRQRSRWASKGPAYRDRDTLLAAATVFLINLSLTASVVAGFFVAAWWLWTLMLYILKSIPDFLLLHSVTSFYRRRKLLWLFPFAQLFYPFYITGTALAGIFSYPFRGKGWERGL